MPAGSFPNNKQILVAYLAAHRNGSYQLHKAQNSLFN